MLTIDIGNSRIKWAQFAGDDIKAHGAFGYEYSDVENALDKAGLPHVSEAVQISCVAGVELKERIKKWLSANDFKEYRFAETRANQCGVTNSYEIVANLGVDRWLAMIAAYKLSETKSDFVTCVIDCGTAVTLDFVDAKGEHMGGLIMPGYSTMVNSLVRDTGNIGDFSGMNEVITHIKKIRSEIAVSTHDAVVNGCVQLMIAGISGIVSKSMKDSEGKMNCLVTGGDGEWVSDALECANTYNPFLVLQGLKIVSGKEQS